LAARRLVGREVAAAAGSVQRGIDSIRNTESVFLLRLEKGDVQCFEWLGLISELANVAISLQTTGGQGFFFAFWDLEVGC
jgi:hypothetical protein